MLPAAGPSASGRYPVSVSSVPPNTLVAGGGLMHGVPLLLDARCHPRCCSACSLGLISKASYVIWPKEKDDGNHLYRGRWSWTMALLLPMVLLGLACLFEITRESGRQRIGLENRCWWTGPLMHRQNHLFCQNPGRATAWLGPYVGAWGINPDLLTWFYSRNNVAKNCTSFQPPISVTHFSHFRFPSISWKTFALLFLGNISIQCRMDLWTLPEIIFSIWKQSLTHSCWTDALAKTQRNIKVRLLE